MNLIESQTICMTLARMFHNYWGLGKINANNKIIINDNEEITCSRIFLVNIISLVIKKA